jgi:hypothetical protein
MLPRFHLAVLIVQTRFSSTSNDAENPTAGSAERLFARPHADLGILSLLVEAFTKMSFIESIAGDFLRFDILTTY